MAQIGLIDNVASKTLFDCQGKHVPYLSLLPLHFAGNQDTILDIEVCVISVDMDGMIKYKVSSVSYHDTNTLF